MKCNLLVVVAALFVQLEAVGSSSSETSLLGNRPFNVENHYLNADTADVFFNCGKDETVRERIPAHKILLAGSTNAFDTMFYGALPERNEVTIVDATPNGFRQFLRFFYTNDLQLKLEFIDELMYLAKKYLVDSFFDECCRFLSEQVNAEGTLVGYELSLRFEVTDLKEKLEYKIKKNSHQIFYSNYFTTISRDLLNEIVQIPLVRVEASKSVFHGCIRWARAACIRLNIDSSIIKNIRVHCFQHIELSAMTSSEIIECIDNYGDLFTAQELQQIVFMISAKCTIPVPVAGSVVKKVSKNTNVTVTASKGFMDELQFIPKKRLLFNAFSVSKCFEFDGDGSKGYLARVAKMSADRHRKHFLHTECFPFDHHYAFREDIILEPLSIYSIQILFLNGASYDGREEVLQTDSVIDILHETKSNFIVALDFFCIIGE